MTETAKRRSGIFWWLMAGPLVVLAVITLRAFPYLAITEPGGSKVLVVEGWMDEAALLEAARLVLDSGYAAVYTTGTVRDLAHYLGESEGLTVELHDPLEGQLSLTVSGITGAGLWLIADTDTLLDMAVALRPQVYKVALGKAVGRLRIVAWPMALQAGTPALFVRSMTIDGRNINYFQRRSWFTFPDALAEPAWPTFAQSARSQLITAGVPAGIITAVPAYGKPRSRTWGNAHAFGIHAREEGITAFDVATVGVHARRSRDLFQTACGPSAQVGVIALTDPYCTRNNWWRSYRGWITVLKEIVGAPVVQAVELTR